MTPSERETPTLTDYWAILRRRRRTIVARDGRRHRARGRVRLVVGSAVHEPGVGRDPADPHRTRSTSRASTTSAPAPRRRCSTRPSSPSSRRKKLHTSPADPKDLLEHLTVENPIGTLILNITFTGDEPRGRADRRAGVRRGVPRLPPQTADAMKARTLERLQQPARRARPGARATRSSRSRAPRSAATPGPTPRRAATSSSARSASLESSSSALDAASTPSPGSSSARPTCPSAQSGPSPMLLLIAAASSAPSSASASRSCGTAPTRASAAATTSSRSPARSRWSSSRALGLGRRGPWRRPGRPGAISLRRLRVARLAAPRHRPAPRAGHDAAGHDRRRRGRREPRGHVARVGLERAPRLAGPARPSRLLGAGPPNVDGARGRRAARAAARRACRTSTA